MYAAAPGGAVQCQSCFSGTGFVDAVTPCAFCKAGQYGSNGLCSPCSAGSFTDTDGFGTCSSCSAGYYALIGSTACSPCPIGTRAANGLCTTCTAGA